MWLRSHLHSDTSRSSDLGQRQHGFQAMFVTQYCIHLSAFSFPFLSFPFPALTYSFLSYPIPFFPTRSKNLFPFPKLSYPIMSFPFLSHPIVRYPNLSYPVFSPSLISFLSFPFSPLSLSIFSFLFPNYYPSLSHHFNSFSFFFFFLHLSFLSVIMPSNNKTYLNS